MTNKQQTNPPENSQDTKPRPKRLGRGLSSLLGDINLAETPITPPINTIAETDQPSGVNSAPHQAVTPSAHQIRHLPIEWIMPGPWQPRQLFLQEELNELAQSIQQRGLIQPILVRPHPEKQNRYQLIAGERRWRAAQIARLHEIPSVIKDHTECEAAEVSLIENIQRQDLSVIEEATGYRSLMEQHGYTQQDLSDIVGKSRPHIANLLRLSQLPKAVKDMLVERQITMGQIKPLIGHPDAEDLAMRIFNENLSARDVEDLAKTRSKKPRKNKQKSADIQALEMRARTELGLQMRIDWNEQQARGQLSIKLSDLEQLDDLLAKLGLV